MDITEDLKICNEIMEQYRNLTTEDGEGAFKLSQVSIAMYDRLNELRLQVNTLGIKGVHTKSDLKEYLRSKMKLMEYIHVESRAIFNSLQNDHRRFRRD